MGSLTEEDKGMLWKLRALLIARGFHKRQVWSAQDLAEIWEITERQAYRYLAEADEIFKQLTGLFLLQPDLPKKSEEAERILRNLSARLTDTPCSMQINIIFYGIFTAFFLAQCCLNENCNFRSPFPDQQFQAS